MDLWKWQQIQLFEPGSVLFFQIRDSFRTIVWTLPDLAQILTPWLYEWLYLSWYCTILAYAMTADSSESIWTCGFPIVCWILFAPLSPFGSSKLTFLTISTIAVKSLTQPVVEIKSMKILPLDQLSVLKNKSMAKCRTVDTYCLGLEARHHRVGELDVCFPVGVLYRL